jgi:hypothetical protein
MMRAKTGFIGVVLGAWLAAAPLAPAAAGPPPLPYRFLLVVNDQWKDPASEVMEKADELSILCVLLKSWGLPFDIHRLDQLRFDAYHVLDRSGRPLHGTIIWNAPGATLDAEAEKLLRGLVTTHGVGLVAFSDTVLAPVVAELTGVKPTGKYEAAVALAPAGAHFISRGVQLAESTAKVSSLLRNRWPGATVEAASGTAADVRDDAVVVRRGGRPFLTARQAPGGGRIVWLDAERTTGQLWRQSVRDLFKRALVWANGYALYVEYPRTALLFMDDMGASDKTYYSVWHYPTLSEELIRTALIEPLQRHKAVLVQNVNTGYIDRKTRRVLNPWEQTRVVDELDPTIIHDFASTKRGLDAGVKAGVFEIQSHGWTHVLPDLDSPPGPFWSAPATSPVIQGNWYNEFGDNLRKIEVPAAVQRLHLQRSLDELWADFGVRAISLRVGGGVSSHSPAHNTLRVAAKMGFGVGQAEALCYLGSDFSVTLEPVSPRLGWKYTDRLPAAEVPWTIDAPVWIGLHDRDIALDAAAFPRLLEDLGAGVRYLTTAEYCGYLHAVVERAPATDGALALRVRYDDKLGAFFRTHPSSWVLHLADETRAALKSPAAERRRVELPAGLGSHAIVP